MPRIVIPKANWKPQLSTTLSRLKDGDTLILPHGEAKAEALRLLALLRPDALIFIEMKEG